MMMKTMVTPLGKLMWEKQLFEISGNWKAAEILQEKITKYLINIKERKPVKNEEPRREFAYTAVGT